MHSRDAAAAARVSDRGFPNTWWSSRNSPRRYAQLSFFQQSSFTRGLWTMLTRKALASLLMTTLVLPAFGAGTPERDGVDATPAVSAEDVSNSGQLAEVVITAEKRVSTVHDTPISISAVSGDALLTRGVVSLAALAQGTPGLSLKSEGPSQTEIEMRGMTSSGGNSATVGFYLDDIPLTGPAS